MKIDEPSSLVQQDHNKKEGKLKNLLKVRKSPPQKLHSLVPKKTATLKG
jgi:hypothetical protein